MTVRVTLSKTERLREWGPEEVRALCREDLVALVEGAEWRIERVTPTPYGSRGELHILRAAPAEEPT